jgi:hypothetical protein
LLATRKVEKGHRMMALTPTQRSVQISRTTLFGLYFTAQLSSSFGKMKASILVAVTGDTPSIY